MHARLIGLLLGAAMMPAPALAAPEFSAELFKAKLDAELKPVAASYSWSFLQGGKMHSQNAKGYARTPGDGNRLHGPMVRQNIASVSKLVTATMTMQLLRAIGKDEDTKIAAYLPGGWTKGPNIDKLTFAHLLGHRSGFPNANNNSEALLDWNAMRAMVAAGVAAPPPTPAPPAGIDYRNVNFALLRVLMPQMYAQTGQRPEVLARTMQAQLGELGPPSNGAVYQPAINNYFYAAWAQTRLFDKIGIKGALCQDKSPTQTLYYKPGPGPSQTGPGEKSMGNNSWTNFCGSGGWHLSSNDLARLISFLRRTEVLLPAEWSQRMIDKRFGYRRSIGAHGDYFSHDGLVGSGGGGGIYACAMRFSNNVEAALVMNTKIPDKLTACGLLQTAFDKAWK